MQGSAALPDEKNQHPAARLGAGRMGLSLSSPSHPTRKRLGSGRQGAPVPFTLCGPTCDSTDVISKTQKLPDDIDEEDLVVFQNSAAYSEAVSTHFNGMNPPAIHFLDELVSG